jgi:hypothetical protein
MPVLGQGIVPSGGLGTELQYVVRRAFVPKLVVQIYNMSPLTAALLANSQPATGGVSSVTVPAQGSSFVNLQWVGYDGSFAQPAIQPGVTNLEFNLKGAVVPIPYLGFEGMIQQDHEVIDLLQARFNDASNVYCDGLGTALYNNSANTQQIIGLPGAIDDGTNTANYGNQSRTVNPWLKSKRYNAGAVNPTRALVMQYITGTAKNAGESPTFGIMGPGTWQTLANDYIGNERYLVDSAGAYGDRSEGAKSAFRALMVSDVPIYLDPYCPEGTLYLMNTGYMAFYIHERAAFSFTGFQSTLPNFQLGSIGAVVSLLELVNAKPKTCTVVTNFTFITI